MSKPKPIFKLVDNSVASADIENPFLDDDLELDLEDDQLDALEMARNAYEDTGYLRNELLDQINAQLGANMQFKDLADIDSRSLQVMTKLIKNAYGAEQSLVRLLDLVESECRDIFETNQHFANEYYQVRSYTVVSASAREAAITEAKDGIKQHWATQDEVSYDSSDKDGKPH